MGAGIRRHPRSGCGREALRLVRFNIRQGEKNVTAHKSTRTNVK